MTSYVEVNGIVLSTNRLENTVYKRNTSSCALKFSRERQHLQC